MFKQLLIGATLFFAAVGLAASAQADYPERKILAVIPWGSGGATDTIMRALTPLAEQALDGKITLLNWRGNSAVTGSSFVLKQRADGYTLLLGAENPQLYRVLGLADFDYSAFYPINIIGQNLVIIATHADSHWNSMNDLLAEAKTTPHRLRMGSTGAGGLPSTVHAMISSVSELKVQQVSFDGDGPGITALLNKRIDFMPLSLASTREHLRNKQLKVLAVVANESIPQLPGVEPISTSLPEMAEYLPWGPFWGVFVHRDTPDTIKRKLVDAYTTAVASQEFYDFLHSTGAQHLNLSGNQAEAFLTRWQSITAWSMHKAQAIEIDPQSLGIAKP